MIIAKTEGFREMGKKAPINSPRRMCPLNTQIGSNFTAQPKINLQSF